MRHITHLRNRDFIKQCRRSAEILRGRGDRPTDEEIVMHALAQPAPAYYVDFYRATSILGRGEDDIPEGKYASSRQWHDMAADLRELRSRRPHSRLTDIILDLCVGRAGHPRFYISPRRALEIYESTELKARG